MKRRARWLPILVVLILPLLAACGLNRFDARGWSGLTIENGTLYVASGEKGHALALELRQDQDNAVQLWRHQPVGDKQELGSIYGAPAFASLLADDGTERAQIIVATYKDPEIDDDFDFNLYSFNGETGELNWPFVLPGRIVSSPVLVDGMLLVGTTDGMMHALRLDPDPQRSPEVLWSFPAAEGGEIWSTPVVVDGTVYFGTMAHNVYALNVENGESVWDKTVDVGGAVVGSPLVVGDTVYVGALDRNLYALDAATGEEKWEFSGDNWFWAAPVSDGQTIYAATLGGNIYAIDSAGNLRWSGPAKIEKAIVASPVVLDDALIVGTKDGNLHKVRLTNGQIDPRFIPIRADIRAGLVERDGVVYLIDSDGFVHAVDTVAMQEIWQRPFDASR